MKTIAAMLIFAPPLSQAQPIYFESMEKCEAVAKQIRQHGDPYPACLPVAGSNVGKSDE